MKQFYQDANIGPIFDIVEFTSTTGAMHKLALKPNIKTVAEGWIMCQADLRKVYIKFLLHFVAIPNTDLIAKIVFNTD